MLVFPYNFAEPVKMTEAALYHGPAGEPANNRAKQLHNEQEGVVTWLKVQ
jgi:hypothetical protein